jgi:hypothetical protein
MNVLIVTRNVVEDNAKGVGGWGGTCTCPDGQSYQVGDNDNACESIACINGNAGECNRKSGPWKKRKVTCAVLTGKLRWLLTLFNLLSFT